MATSTEVRGKETSFLKWSAPTMAKKLQVSAEDKMRRLIKPPASLEEKCGELREVLNCIQPPKEWISEGHVWQQVISNEPATRSEVIKLTEALDEAIIMSQAKETGICEIREAIFADMFDELIRQSAINCIERGLLLLRVRNEARFSIKAFKRLYVSSISYGIRKTLESDEEIKILKEEVNKLSGEKDILEKELENVMFTIAEKEKELAERMEEIVSKHRTQIELQEEIHSNLKYQLLTITSVNKSKT